MDSCSSPSPSDDDDDQFFETLDHIASSSSHSQCLSHTNHPNRSLPHHLSSLASSFSASSISRYELWKSSPGEIAVRRWRLRAQMGLESQAHPFSRTVTNEGSGTDLTSSASESVHSQDANPEAYDRKDQDPGNLNDPANRVCANATSSSNGSSSTLRNVNTVLDSRSTEPGAASPVLHHRGAYGDDTVCHSSSKPPLATKKRNGNAFVGVNSTDGLLSRRSQTYSNRLRKYDVADDSVRIVSHPNEPPVGDDREGSSKSDKSISSMDAAVESEVASCRIKDLDSGKEFVVNEPGKDGIYRLKELDTGKEMTLEEFELSVGRSPIVQEVMRREMKTESNHVMGVQVNAAVGVRKTKRGWFKSIKEVVTSFQDKSSYSGSDDREASTEKSRRSGSTTDDNLDSSILGRPVKIRAHRKDTKEFAGLHMRQQIQAHDGPIWAMKFSHDGAYLASAGQDKVVKVWEVLEKNVGSKETVDYLGEFNSNVEKVDDNVEWNSKSRSVIADSSFQVQKLFGFCENAKCNFFGHTEDILDLSWSPSQLLLSSSMDKTVRLWKVSCTGCLKVFKHNDYVTCIQFHPLDDGHFISGSLDGKVRVWKIEEPQVVDWVDVREMVTAAYYAPDGMSAFVGSYKGICRLYRTSGGKLQHETTFEVRSNRSRRSQGKKITGFQFLPKHKRKVLITSSDSRIRVYSGTEVISKYKGFKNSKSQIAASFTSDGQYIVCASEDSRVYIWNYSDPELEYPGRQRKLSNSYERFTSENVSVAIFWPGMSYHSSSEFTKQSEVIDDNFSAEKEGGSCHVNSSITSSSLGAVVESETLPCTDVKLSSNRMSHVSTQNGMSEIKEMRSPTSYHKDRDNRRARYSSSRPAMLDSYLEDCCGSSMLSSCMPSQSLGGNSGFFAESKVSATWPEEKLQSLHEISVRKPIVSIADPVPNMGTVNDKRVAAVPLPALGIVIVTASLEGDIRIFQNFGLPVRF